MKNHKIQSKNFFENSIEGSMDFFESEFDGTVKHTQAHENRFSFKTENKQEESK